MDFIFDSFLAIDAENALFRMHYSFFSGFIQAEIVKIKSEYSFEVVPTFKAEKNVCDKKRKTHIFSDASAKEKTIEKKNLRKLARQHKTY